jgi:signal transduction histidine kinase
MKGGLRPNAAAGLVGRLVAIQFVAWAITGLIVVAFAPRLLLLDDSVVGGSTRLALWGWGATVGLVVISTWAVGRGVRPLLRKLAAGDKTVEPNEVLGLYSVPARLVVLDLTGTLVVGAVTLIPTVRPETNDLYTQIEVVLLVMTMASVAVLPAYVGSRASVARVLELVPVAAAREVIEQPRTRQLRIAPVRQRLLAAVVAPVAFVALGASLLVHAHLRAFDTSSRQNDAAELVQGVLDLVEGDPRGRTAALEEASAHGLDVGLFGGNALFAASRNDDGTTTLTVPLADGYARARFRTARLSPWTGVYLAVALWGLGIAWVLGHRIGRMFVDDVALATRELEATGVADVLRGDRPRAQARFRSVADLMGAADGLGAVFREFARAQQRAIDARTAIERTRALFLASMSHDLKAPLNAVLGFAGLASRGPLSENQRESLAIIERRGRELLYLIATILDAARAEAGELTIAPEHTHISDVIMTTVSATRELAQNTKAQIVAEIQPGAPRVLVDPQRLSQALTAIVLVALRFADRGHAVIRAAMPAVGEQLRIDVEVTGLGTATEDREKVFDAFKQTQRVRKHGSLGLGPRLARTIVELHGGKVAVETTEAGGTVFRVWLPSERSSR